MFILFIGLYLASTKRFRIIIFITFIILLIALMTLHYSNPDLIVKYKDERSRYIDLLSGNIIYYFFLFFMVNEIIRNYTKDAKELQLTNKELIIKSEKITKTTLILKENEEKFKRISQQVPDVIYITDNFGNITYISDSAKKIFGYNPGEMVGKLLPLFLHESEIERAFAVLKKSLSSGEESKELPFIIKKKDNSLLNVEISGTVYYENGQVVGTIGIIRDISERIIAEKEILKLSKVVEQSPATIMITNVNGDIEYVNPNFVKITGYQFEEVAGKNPRFLKSGKMNEKIYKHMWETILSGKEWKGELYNKKKNGQFYWEMATIFPIKDDIGNITHFIALKQDITERKRLTQELIKAKNKAEESDRLKSAFLANMSHEIRTPLNGIIGFAKILSNKNITKTNHEKYLKIIQRNTDSLLHIINDILDISKIESGQLEINNSSVQINSLLEDVYQLYLQKGLVADRKQIKFEQVKWEKNITLNIDEFRLRQIFINLIDNAVKFTKEGKIEFGIYSIENDWITFFVSDTGIGIPKESQKIIFDRFSQIELKDKSSTGNGLGLAIVKQLVKLMKGKITLESEVGQGSLFSFTFPYNH